MVNKTGFDIFIIETNALLGKRWEVAGCSTFYLFLKNFAETFQHFQNWATEVCFFCKRKIIHENIWANNFSPLTLSWSVSMKITGDSLYYSSMYILDIEWRKIINFGLNVLILSFMTKMPYYQYTGLDLLSDSSPLWTKHNLVKPWAKKLVRNNYIQELKLDTLLNINPLKHILYFSNGHFLSRALFIRLK